MSNPFAERKPWAAALLTVVFGALAGMLYLNRGKLALLYFALGLAAIAAAFAFLPQLLAGGFTPQSLSLLAYPVTFAAAIHAYFLARRRNASEPLRWYARLPVVVFSIVIGPIVAVVVRTFLYQPFNATTTSMSPTVNIGEVFLVSKFAYKQHAPARGDIAAFYVPSKELSFIKRIVGLPGEHIQMVDGALVIDGKTVPRRRVEDFVETGLSGALEHVAQFEETLPGGRHVRVLDRGASDFDNTAAVVVPQDSYFVLGDNRDNSDDSRGNIGFVRRGDLLGPAIVKYLETGHWAWRKLE